MLYLCNLYGMTGWGKIAATSDWWAGTPLSYHLVHPQFGGTWLGVWLSTHPWLLAFCAWWTLIFEAAFPLLIWVKRLRGWVVLLGLSLHLGLFLLMDVGPFSITAIVMYPILLEPGEFLRIKAWLQSHRWTMWWQVPWIMVRKPRASINA
jgi:hypothetical protein